MVNSAQSHATPQRIRLPVWIWVVAVLCPLILIGLFIGTQFVVQSWSDQQSQHGYSLDRTTVSRRLPGQTLHVPQNFIREADARQDGFSHKLDLAMTWPDLMGFGEAQRDSFAGVKGADPLILLSVQPIAHQPSGAALLNSVYVHEFSNGTLYGPAGLVGKKLRAPGPFAHEIVWYDPLPKNPFVAKCDDPETSTLEVARTQPMCTRTLRVNQGLSISYRFPLDILAQRREMDKAISQRILGFMPSKTTN